VSIRKKPLGWVLLCGALLSLPVVLFGFPYPTHDARTHDVWYTAFSAQFWAGEWYPRWLQNLDGGLGGPTFYFYPPVAYFATALLQPLYASASQVWHVMGLSAAIALILSGVFAYLWLRPIAGERPAAVAAMLYMAMPYHFATDLHIRGAFGEFWAFVWMPLILLFVDRALRRERFAAVGLAISYALLIMTHLPTTLIFSIIPPLWVWYIADRGDRMRALVRVGAPMALGIGLSAIYLMPAMLEQSPVSMQAMRTGDYYYAKAFFFPDPALESKFSVARDWFTRRLFLLTLTTFIVGAYAFVLARRSTDASRKRQATFWVVLAAFTVAMMFRIGQPLYIAIPQLQLIQFPWRFNAVLALSVAALISMGLSAISRPYARSTERILAVVAVLVFYWITFSVEPLVATSFRSKPPLVEPQIEIRASNFNTVEYRPRWVTASPRPMLRRLRVEGDTIPKVVIARGTADARVSEWRPRRLGVAVNATGESLLEVRQYFYPGWSATLDGRSRLDVSPADSTGLIRVTVPAGTHQIDFRLEASRAERLGQRVSLASVVLLVGAAVLAAARRGRPV
jgi:hypothetical protein